MASFVLLERPSTFSEVGWAAAITQAARRSATAADILLAELDGGQGS